MLQAFIGVGLLRAPVGLIGALIFALRGRRQTPDSDIQPVLGLTFSWRRAALGGLWGLAVGLVICAAGFAIFRQLSATLGYVPYVPLYAILGVALGGVTRTVGETVMPGRGMRLTIRAAVRGGLLTGAVSCPLLALVGIVNVVVTAWAQGFGQGQEALVAVLAAVAGLQLGEVGGLYFGLLAFSGMAAPTQSSTLCFAG